MLIPGSFTCAACGEINETLVDPSQGPRQTYVEDCQVCCRANVLRIVVGDDAAEIQATAEDG
jgi:hypothetical protein